MAWSQPGSGSDVPDPRWIAAHRPHRLYRVRLTPGRPLGPSSTPGGPGFGALHRPVRAGLAAPHPTFITPLIAGPAEYLPAGLRQPTGSRPRRVRTGARSAVWPRVGPREAWVPGPPRPRCVGPVRPQPPRRPGTTSTAGPSFTCIGAIEESGLKVPTAAVTVPGLTKAGAPKADVPGRPVVVQEFQRTQLTLASVTVSPWAAVLSHQSCAPGFRPAGRR